MKKTVVSSHTSTDKTKKFVYLIVGALFFLVSAHIELPKKGLVKDAETGKPLNDVVVLRGLDYTCYLPPNPGGNSSSHLSVQESYTNIKGYFKLLFKISFKPPLLCYSDKYIKYFKPGYFPSSAETITGEAELYRMTHFLNFEPYRKPGGVCCDYYFEEKSSYYNTALNKMEKLELLPVDEVGVFMSVNGMKFTKIYSKKDRTYKYPRCDTFYVYDDLSRDWILINARGEVLQRDSSSLPKWDVMSSEDGGSIYADKNNIFFPVEKNPRPSGMTYKKNEIKYITPREGSISALVGDVFYIFTIEGKGKSLCQYGDYFSKKSPANNFSPRVIQSFQGKDLPSSKEDDTLAATEFKYLVKTINHGLLVVTKTRKYWHIYSFDRRYDQKKRRVEMNFKEIISFPVKRNITAFTGRGSELYIAFKNEGIRKYTYGYHTVSEDKSFISNTKKANYPEISSLVLGSAVNNLAIYATTGGHKIYRFSLQGVPDYKVTIGN